MRRPALVLIVIVLAAGLYLGVRHRSTGGNSGGATLHKVAPDFSLTDINDQPLALSNFRGKVVLLDFWATWCAPCRSEIPHFVDFQNNYGAQGLQVIGISMDDDAKPVGPFYQEFKMNYPVAVGTAQLADSYGGVLGLPVTFLIDRDGRVAQKYVGAVETSVIEQEVQRLLQAK